MSTIAAYCRDNLGQILALYRTLYGVFAIGCRAPLEVFFVVDVRSREEDMISVLEVGCDE